VLEALDPVLELDPDELDAALEVPLEEEALPEPLVAPLLDVLAAPAPDVDPVLESPPMTWAVQPQARTSAE